MLLVLLIGLSCAVATDTSKDISELEVKKQDIDTNINALKESNVDKIVNQKEIIGKMQNTQIDKIKAKETTKNTITKKEPTISSTEKSTTDDDTQEASNHDAKSNKKSNTDSSTLVPLEDHEEVSYDKNTVSNEVNINPKVTNNIKDSTFNLKNIEEPYKNVSSLNQINTNGTFNLTSDTSGQLTLSDGNTTIYGNNHKIIPNNPNQYFVTINAGQKLTLKNIVIDSNSEFSSDWLYRPAIIVNAGGELILDNCTISKTIQAIKSEGNVTILNSNINNNGRIAHGATIEIKGNSNVYIEKSRLSNNQYCGINVASNQAKVLLNQTELSGSIEMHVYLGNISLYNVTYDGTQITDENKVSNNGIQDTQDKTNKKNIIILEDSMISIDHAQKILNSTTMTINGRLTSGNTYLPNQTLKVYVDDVLIGEVTTNDNGYYTISYTAEEVGNHNIKVTYDGNYKYLPSEAKSSFEVYKIDTNIIINNINDELFDKLANITGTLTNANDEVISNAKVIVTINGNQKILITNSTGGFTYTGAKVLLGDNTVTALFEGTRTYNPSEDTKTFTGKKHDTQITLNPIENTHIDDSIEISGILTDVNGTVLTNKNIIITIDNQQHTITTDDNGKYRITHTITSSGEKTVLVTYDGDTAYNPSSNQTSFNVRKINTTISLDNISDTTIDSTIWISGILKDEFGNILPNTQVSILINTHNITTTTDVNGKYNYSYTTTTLGENRIMVGYIGNDKYSSSYNETSFNVHRINTNLSIDTIDDTTIGSDITISGILKDEFGNLLANKEIIITINGQEYTTTTDNDGKYNYIYKTEMTGLHNIEVIYAGDTTYFPSNNKTTFNVRKINTNLSINDVNDTTIGQEIEISGVLTDEFGNNIPNATIKIIVNGNQQNTTITDTEGNYKVIIKNTLGLNTVFVIYDGNYKYYPSNNQTSFNTTTNTMISINNIDDTTIGSSININGTLKDGEGNTLSNTNLIITINGQKYTVITDNDGKYNYIYTTITLGENIVEVAFTGNTTHKSSNNQTSFNVRKINTNLSIDIIDDTTIGSDITISGVLTDEFGNTLSNTSIVIIINGQEYTTTTDNEGKYNYIYTTSTLGENIVSVNYPGNNKYSPSSNQTSFNVRKINTNLSIDTIDDTTVGRDITVSGVLTDEFGNILANTNITIIVNGNIFKATTDVNGVYNYGYTIDVTGLHRVDVIYSGNTTHFPSNNNTSFNVRKIDTNLSINTINDTTISSNVEVSGTLTDEYENILPNTTITININGQEYTTTTDNNGKYNYTYMVNTLDQNTVIVNYPGDDKYNSATTFTTFNVRKINTKLFINTINDTIVGQDINVGGVLKDEFENILVNTTVEITITNPKGTKNTYTTTTNEEGMYSVTYAGNIDGTYKVEVNYIGNNTYNSSSNETSFNTRKINTKLIIDSIENTTIDTNIFITGKLVDEFGNIVPNTFINITVNNNMIELYVDANGTFTCIYKTSILGENNITLQYNGNDTYNPSSNEASFNVRKLKSTIVVDSIVGYIGENITLTARITDENGKLVNGGNIVFKFNGKTLREDGRFDSTASPMKFKVVDGIVKYITVADAYLRNVKHITATYSGSYNYESSKAEYNHVLLNKRSAQINVTVTPNFTKQNTKIVFNATIKDVTINGTNTSIINNNGKVIFKINGKVVKDEDGNIIFVKVVNNSANYTYYIPNGMASVYNNSVLRNYTVEAVYGNPLYDSDTRNITIFNVEQSPININVANITINKNTNKLTLKANITDYQENLVVGTNKICLKINDKTLTDESNNTIYYYITDGIIDLSNITVPAINNYHNITIVAGERYAYKSNKITSTDINVVDK